jgi:hypothetical protein
MHGEEDPTGILMIAEKGPRFMLQLGYSEMMTKHDDSQVL